MKLVKENKLLFFIIGLLFVLSFGLIIFLIVYVTKPEQSIFDKCYPKVVEVKATTENYGISYGTGTIVDEDLSIITNSHIISYTKSNEYFIHDKIEIRFTNKEEFEECIIIKNDRLKDLTILNIKKPDENKANSYFEIKEVKYKPGDTAFAVGNASNNGISITKGIITMPSFNITYNEITRNVIQVDLNISNGNSGGPLVNEKGQLLGIITFKLKDNNNQIIDGFAYTLSISEILSFF